MTGPLNTRRHPMAAPVADPANDPRLDEGIALFNQGEHWHAHEAWEPLWMGLEGDDKLFLQGLIMAAALLVQHGKGIQRGVENHWANVQFRLGGRAARWGIDSARLMADLEPYVRDGSLDARAVQIRRA
ncbi:MAG: DUF309 domain-containing protein [Candidatus Thermoplasmatota archaeon]